MEKNIEYNVSIIIPVYNADAFLERTLESIIAQQTRGLTYEVLLINDGSTDTSGEICLQYSLKYDNFYYIKQRNKGVSHARNKGLEIAQGEYILFLDADDLLLPQTIYHAITTFEKYKEETNILAYPLYTKEGNDIKPHIRNANFRQKNRSGLYNIGEFPFLNQCTMNVVIKNLDDADKIYFNTSLKQCEDALFNTQMVLTMGNIAFSNNGGYVYDIGHESTVDKFKNPVDIGDMLLQFFENLINNALKHYGSVPAYVQSMILYEINWRFLQNVLFPFHLKEPGYAEWMDRIVQVFDHIEVHTILEQPLMDYYHKIYFIQTFKQQIIHKNDSFGLRFFSKDEHIHTLQHVTIVFNKIKKIGEELQFVGYIKAPLLDNADDVALELTSEQQDYKKTVWLRETPVSYYKSHLQVSSFLGFDFTLDLRQEAEFLVKVKINGVVYKTVPYFEEDIIFKKHIQSKHVVLPETIISYKENPFAILIRERSKNRDFAKNVLAHQSKLYEKKGQRNVLTFRKYKKLLALVWKQKRIWLYNDRINTRDNAFIQFKHDMTKKDGVNRYYVVRHLNEVAGEIPKQKVVLFGSLKHKLLFYYSELILTSFKEKLEYSPLSNQAYNALYSEMKHKVVYLQHGVLNAHTPWLYGKHKTNFDKFLISSDFEKENLKKHYGYAEKDLLQAGMPRLDLITSGTKKNKLLFAPSWRKSLVKEDKYLNRTIAKEAFYQSEFFQAIHAFINSPELNDILKTNNYQLDVKLHPIFMEEGALFNTEQSNIHIIESGEKIAVEEYKLFITDFSSFMFDFIKTKTKIAFFFPDLKRFLGGNHIYNRLDFDIDQFGERYERPEEIIASINRYITEDFRIEPELEELYDAFYYQPVHKNYRETLYQQLFHL